MNKMPQNVYAAQVLKNAKTLAQRIGNEYIDSRHIFIALYTTHRGLAYNVLLKNGLRAEDLHPMAGALQMEGKLTSTGKLHGEYTDRTLQVIQNAEFHAEKLKVAEVGTEHILLAIIKDGNPDVIRLLSKKNINIAKMAMEILVASGLGKVEAEKYIKANLVIKNNRDASKDSPGMLERFTRDMTQDAADGNLDPVIGREAETMRVMQILGRRTKNNACLVGEPGVGKTAIVEGLAQLIVAGNVPPALREKRILRLDLSGMVAGTRYRGDFEERLMLTIDELKANPNIIVFIDELHTIIGAGGAEGTQDAANMIKPALSRGELQVIGATTQEEYRKYIEKDAALERRFQPITVEEPTKEDTLKILEGLRSTYQNFHGVVLSDEALEAAVEMSVRYINDRFLPDKAIDLIDEACSRKNLGEINGSFEFSNEKDGDWFMEHLIEEALHDGNIKKASRMQKTLVAKKKQRELKEAEALADGFISDETHEISADDIAAVVSIWTKIPVTKLNEKEQIRLLKLDTELHKRVVGQDEAVDVVAKAIRRSRAGLRSPDRPIGAFLFLGPTGVGKTELSKALAEVLFGDEKSLIRVDMSEYMEKHSVSKMIGSPPGYVGYDEGGQLSERVRRNPYSVVLFDEVEKAHPDVFNVLLQVLDDGIITDNQGRRVDFKNTIIIMTSNLGANRIIDPKSIGFVTDDSAEKSHEEMKSRVMDEVKQTFRPEFLNRLDDIIVFRALSEQQIMDIAGLMLDELKTRVRNNLGIRIRYGAKLKRFIFEKGYDKSFGARPLRRAVQEWVEDPMSEKLLAGDIRSGDSVSISVVKDEVTFTVKEK